MDADAARCAGRGLCGSTSRTVEVWGPTRQVFALALYVGETVRRSRGMAAEWDPDTEMHRMQKVMAMVDYDGAAVRRAKGHTIQVVSPQASASGPADQGVTDLVQDGHTWWIVKPRGCRRQAVVYTVAPLKRVEHPLMRWAGEVEEVRIGRTEEVREKTVLQALESQMDRGAEAEEVEDVREQIWLALEWVANSKGGEQPRWIVPPGTEEEHRKEALERARRLSEGARKQCLEVGDDPEGERPSKWRGMRRGRGGQMRFIVGNGDNVGIATKESKAWRGERWAGSRGRQQAGGKNERREKKGWKRERRRNEGRRMLLGTGWKSGTLERGQERVERGKTASRGEKRMSRSRKQGGNRRRTRKGGQGGSGRGESSTGRNKRAVRSRGRCGKG